MSLSTQMAIYADREILDALNNTPEGQALVDEMGFYEARDIMREAWSKKYVDKLPQFVNTSLVIGGLILAVVGGVAALGGMLAGSLGGVGSGLSTSFGGASSVAKLSLAISGMRLGLTAFNTYERLTREDPTAARELYDLSTWSTEKLREYGYSDSEIQWLRQLQRDITGIGGTASLPSAVVPQDYNGKVASFLGLVQNLVSSGVDVQYAVHQASVSMNGWSPEQYVVDQIVAANYSQLLQMKLDAEEKAKRQAVSDYRADYNFQSQMTGDYQRDTRFGWDVEDRDYVLQMQGYNVGTQEYNLYSRFYDVFDNLRARGLPPEQAIEQASRQTGFVPDDVVIERLLMDAQNQLDEFMGAYQTNEVYTMIQDMLNWNMPEGPHDEYDIADFQGYGKGSMASSNLALPDYSPTDFKGVKNIEEKSEENMSYRSRRYGGFTRREKSSYYAGLRAGRRRRY